MQIGIVDALKWQNVANMPPLKLIIFIDFISKVHKTSLAVSQQNTYTPKSFLLRSRLHGYQKTLIRNKSRRSVSASLKSITLDFFLCIACSQSITPEQNKFQGHWAMRYRNICFKKAHGHLRRCNASIQPWGSRWVILMSRKVTSFAHFIKSRAQLAFEVFESFLACYLLYVVTPRGLPPSSLNLLLGESNKRTRLKHCWASGLSSSYPS